MRSVMSFDELLSSLQNNRTVQDHPDWPRFRERKLPQYVNFYYTNKDGQEAYWEHARIIKIDLKNLHLIIEGAHSDPLKFEIRKIMHCKDAKTGEKVQDLFFDLIRMWDETYLPEA